MNICVPRVAFATERKEVLVITTSLFSVPYLVPILFSLIIIVGSVGNILVVLVVSLNKTMRNNTNILILNLAVSMNLCILSLSIRYNKAFNGECPSLKMAFLSK